MSRPLPEGCSRLVEFEYALGNLVCNVTPREFHDDSVVWVYEGVEVKLYGQDCMAWHDREWMPEAEAWAWIEAQLDAQGYDLPPVEG